MNDLNSVEKSTKTKEKISALLASDFDTEKEIAGQPTLWRSIFEETINRQTLQQFLNPVLNHKDLQIVLTGAGSSAFIGESVEQYFKEGFSKPARAISTTTLVTNFTNYVDTDKSLLLISFARSGNSPESNAVVDLAEKHCKNPHHLAITCNKKGKLARRMDALNNSYSVVLPPEAEDKSLAMTGSFSGMMLTALLIADLFQNKICENCVDTVSAIAENFLENDPDSLKEIAESDFNRIIFLGSGPLLGIARESHLKVQELSDGQTIGKFDSFLGFRHGPKAILNNRTVVVCLFSPNPDTFRYEKDLAEQMIQNDTVHKLIGVFPSPDHSQDLKTDLNIILNFNKSLSFNGVENVPYVLPAQIIGLYKSLSLGLNPDSPSQSGAISRVVKGVKIYD